MNTTEIIIKDLSSLKEVAIKLLEISNSKIFFFYGDLGAGKTSLIKSLCQELGVDDIVNSPTYALIHEYESLNNTIYHMDLYRLKSIEEAYEIGIEDYLYSGNYCFIEWPQILEQYIEEQYHTIHLEELEGQIRKLVFK